MFTLNYLSLIIIILCSSPVDATEVDLDYKIKRQFVTSEAQIEQNNISISKNKKYIKALFDELEAAMISDDSYRLKNILLALSIQLKEMQGDLAAHDSRIESHRVSLAKASKSIQKKQTHLGEPASNEWSFTLGSDFFGELSEKDKQLLGPQISRFLQAIEERNKIYDLIRKIKIPGSPYDSAEGIKAKHTRMALARMEINIDIDIYKQLQSIAEDIVEMYISRELTSASMTESDYKSFLRIFEDIIETSFPIPEKSSVENPYSAHKNTVGQ